MASSFDPASRAALSAISISRGLSRCGKRLQRPLRQNVRLIDQESELIDRLPAVRCLMNGLCEQPVEARE